MSKQKKPDLSRVDAFQRFFMQLAHWIKRNTRQIIIVVAPLALVTLVVLGGQIYMQSQKGKRLAALATINRVYDDEQQKANDKRSEFQEKIKAISKLEDKKDKDKPAQVQQLEAQLKAVRADHSQSLGQYREFFAAHQTSPEGWAAAMAAVGIAISDQQHDTAHELLTALLKHSTKNDFYQVQARLLYIKLLEEKGSIEQALTETEQIYRLAPQEFKAETLLIKARLLLSQKQNSEALAVCEEIIKDFADSRAASKARAIKVLLN